MTFPVVGLQGAEWSALALSGAASWCDIRTRHIPNLLTLGGALAGLAFTFASHGGGGLLTSGAGWVTGLALFLPFYLLGGMGAGDVKLLACLGAWLGPWAAFMTGLYAAIAGGALAVVMAFASGHLGEALLNIRLLLAHWSAGGVRPLPLITLEHSKAPRLPYAVPIFFGVLMALWRP